MNLPALDPERVLCKFPGGHVVRFHPVFGHMVWDRRAAGLNCCRARELSVCSGHSLQAFARVAVRPAVAVAAAVKVGGWLTKQGVAGETSKQEWQDSLNLPISPHPTILKRHLL